MKVFVGIVMAAILFGICAPREADAYLDGIVVHNTSDKCAMFTLYQRPIGINTQEYYSGEHHIVLPGEHAHFGFIWRQASYAKMNVDVYTSKDCSGKVWANTYDRFDIDSSSHPQTITGTLRLIQNAGYKFWFDK